MQLIRPGLTMRHNFIDSGGFDPPRPHRRRKRQRKALSLIATLALMVSTAIAVTVVSIGIAQAEILVATHSGDGSLAIAFLVCSIIIGGIVGVLHRDRQQRPH